MKYKITIITIFILLWTGAAFSQNNKKPRLVLQITVDQLRGDLPDKFMKNMGEELIHEFFPPYLYLNEKVIAEKGLDLYEVEKAVAKEIMGFKGVALAVSRYELEHNQLPDTYLNRKALKK